MLETCRVVLPETAGGDLGLTGSEKDRAFRNRLQLRWLARECGHSPATRAGEPPPPTGEVILYPAEDGRSRVECRFAGETVWLTQALMAELFGKDVRTINEHLQNLFEEGELDPGATIRKFRIVRIEGGRDVARLIEHYSLDAILAVGYRVRSPRGVQFRRWATERLSEYLVKGFTMDDQRLKNPPIEGSGVPDYFDELLERIRDIRASERRMYLRVKEIFALAADYRASDADSVKFFQIMQEQAPLRRQRKNGAGTDLGTGRLHQAEHGSDYVEGRSRPKERRDYCEELPESRDRRVEPDRRDVAGLCGGSGKTPQTGVPAGLGDQTE